MENFIQHRTMKKARDVRDQFESLLERVEIDQVCVIFYDRHFGLNFYDLRFKLVSSHIVVERICKKRKKFDCLIFHKDS